MDTFTFAVATGLSCQYTCPADGAESPVNMRNRVDFPDPEGFADVFVNGQLELLGLLKLRANQFARVAEHLEKKPDLFVDRLRRGFLAQPVFLIVEHRGIRDVTDDLRSEETSHMPQSILGKRPHIRNPNCSNKRTTLSRRVGMCVSSCFTSAAA
jgi:hypothetical protein